MPDSDIKLMVGATTVPDLPVLTRLLSKGVHGDDVKHLQLKLKALGFPLHSATGHFSDETERAVILFQTQAGITIDGIVGPETWDALGGDYGISGSNRSLRERLADIAQREGAKQLRWIDIHSEAEKYLAPLREPLRERNQLGTAPVVFNWCAAFVTWCCRQSGMVIPDAPDHHQNTMALVQSWKVWALQKGYWHDKNGFKPMRGDIVVFEWNDDNGRLDHIGVVRGYTNGSDVIQTSEGNNGNKTGNFVRNMRLVPGFIRID